jgi:hypothetical protein
MVQDKTRQADYFYFPIFFRNIMEVAWTFRFHNADRNKSLEWFISAWGAVTIHTRILKQTERVK